MPTFDHKQNCCIVRYRRELAAEMEADPDNKYLKGAWVEYFDGGDQEVELCDCGAVAEGVEV